MAVAGYGNVGKKVEASITSGITSTTTTIFNKSVPVPNTEVSQVLPANTKEFLVKSRLGGTIKLAYSSGDTGVLYLTIPSGTAYSDKNFYAAVTVYLQSSKVDVVELVCFT